MNSLILEDKSSEVLIKRRMLINIALYIVWIGGLDVVIASIYRFIESGGEAGIITK